MRAVIFANGLIADLVTARTALRPDDLLIAADGGAVHCRALGVRPQIVVGDCDSLAAAALAELAAAGTELIRHPARKDQTDLELAVRLALARGADEVLILGALGGRWDQTLANLLLLAAPDFAAARVWLADGAQRIYLINGPGAIEGRVGSIVSLIPVGGDATGVTTVGLEYALADGCLPFGSTLGVSNVLTAERAWVTARAGRLLCFVLPPAGAA